MLTAETKRRLDACRDVLVGKLPLPTDQIELITLALIYKFMDDLDEASVKLGGKGSFFVGPLQKYRWRALLPQKVSADDRMNLFAEGIEAIGKAEHLPALFRDIFRNSFLKFRDGRILTLFLNEVNGFEYSHSEELGNAFEYLLKTMGIQAENGQFRTPRHIINFMVDCLDPQPNDRILDPACGTGGFLVSAYQHILAQHTSPGSKIPGDKLTYEQRQKVYSNLSGYDVTDLMVKLSKVNLFLHGFPDPKIHIYDTLTNDTRWNERADLILANPPFMTPKGGVSPHTKFRVSARKTEVLFTDYIAEHLFPEGRAGVVIPNGIAVTAHGAYLKLRKFLIEDSLVAVLSLPAGVFKPYSDWKTSVLFLHKTLSRKLDKILFLKITADGFDLGDKRTPIEANDLPEAERVIKRWLKGKTVDTTLKCVAIEKKKLFAARDITLSVEKFVGEPTANGQRTSFVKLGDVITLEYGRALKEGARTGSGFPVFGSNGEIGRHEKFMVRGPFIIVGRKGSAGAVTWSTESGWPIDTTFYVSPKRDDVDLRYLYWMLKKAELSRLVQQGVPGLNRNDAYETEIPLPKLTEQQRIVAEIEECETANVRLEEQIAANTNRVELILDSVWNGNS